MKNFHKAKIISGQRSITDLILPKKGFSKFVLVDPEYMRTNIMIFGQLAEITETSNIDLNGVQTTEELKTSLLTLYPALAEINFVIAVDKQIISENTVLKDNCTVALLPPFSGG